MVNRRAFGQRLLKEAMDSGASLLDSTQALEPIIEGGFVKGVVIKDLRTNLKMEIKERVTIDASGYAAVLRRRLPPEVGIDATVDRKDEVLCYREIRVLKTEIEEPEFCQIYLDLETARADTIGFSRPTIVQLQKADFGRSQG